MAENSREEVNYHKADELPSAVGQEEAFNAFPYYAECETPCLEKIEEFVYCMCESARVVDDSEDADEASDDASNPARFGDG